MPLFMLCILKTDIRHLPFIVPFANSQQENAIKNANKITNKNDDENYYD